MARDGDRPAPRRSLGRRLAPWRGGRVATTAAPVSGLRPADVAADLPGGTDWVWRPDRPEAALDQPASGTALTPQITVWHDAATPALALRPGDTPVGLGVESGALDATFLSLAIALPPAALAGLSRDHILRLDLRLTMDRALSAYARINIRNGPNTDRIQRHLGDLGPRADGAPCTPRAEFDLHLTQMNPRRIEAVWLDLILEDPAQRRVEIGDLILSRHLRAQF